MQDHWQFKEPVEDISLPMSQNYDQHEEWVASYN